MPKLKFKGAPHLTEYHGLIDIMSGEVKDVDSAIAHRLLAKFPGMFELVGESELVDSRNRGRPPALLKEVDRRFSKTIEELLAERASKSVREIAKELGVSKSLIAKWRRRMSPTAAPSS